MAETTKFVIEGDVTLAYFTGHRDSRQVLIEYTLNPGESDCCPSQRLETKIAEELEFPSESEFDVMFQKLEELREQGLRPDKGQPDLVRSGTKLRITVEIL